MKGNALEAGEGRRGEAMPFTCAGSYILYGNNISSIIILAVYTSVPSIRTVSD